MAVKDTSSAGNERKSTAKSKKSSAGQASGAGSQRGANSTGLLGGAPQGSAVQRPDPDAAATSSGVLAGSSVGAVAGAAVRAGADAGARGEVKADRVSMPADARADSAAAPAEQEASEAASTDTSDLLIAGATAPLRRVRRRQPDAPTRYRVVFAGPVGAGKTTAVRALSDVAAVDTDVPISHGSADRGDGEKTTTTVGLDYGVWKPTTQISVSLVGTPGQERFAAARSSVMMPNTHVVLWLRADRPEIARDAAEWLDKFVGGLHRVGIAVTRTEGDDPSAARAMLGGVLQRYGISPMRVQSVDARDRDSVMRVVSTALDFPEEAAS